MTVFFERRELLEAFRRGERQALGAVYQAYVAEVESLVRRGFAVDSKGSRVPGVRERDRWRDLVQEVFVRAFSYQARSGYDGVSPFRFYILRIAKNLMIDEARKQGRLLELEPDPAEAHPPPEVEIPRPEDDLEWHWLRQATRAYCAGLSEKLQHFVQLRFEEDRSERDAAEALQVSRRKIRSWERQVRDGLLRYLRSSEARATPRRVGQAALAADPADEGLPSGARSREQSGS